MPNTVEMATWVFLAFHFQLYIDIKYDFQKSIITVGLILEVPAGVAPQIRGKNIEVNQRLCTKRVMW